MVNVLALNLALDQLTNATNPNIILNSGVSSEINAIGTFLNISDQDWVELILFFIIFIVLMFPLGNLMYKIFDHKSHKISLVTDKLEHGIYAITQINPDNEMDWKTYAASFLIFNGIGFIFLYLLLEIQNILPLNPNH